MTWIFNEYLIELQDALQNVGITDVQVRNVNRDEMDRLYGSWNIPEETRGNVAVDIDGKYFFINMVTDEIVADFPTNQRSLRKDRNI